MLRLGHIMEGPGASWVDWRHPDAEPGSMYNIEWLRRRAQLCEAAKFDFIFVADSVYVTTKSAPYSLSRLEPVTMMSALAMVTRHIGLAATVTATYTEPFNVARLFGSLDQISGGRAAWNLVTSFTDDSGLNFGADGLPSHDLRYRMADDHLEVVQKLWDSWEDDAMVHDKGRGLYIDSAKVHTIDHAGPFYRVKGPLNMVRSPQGQPVIFQAGASEAGRDFAARRADCVFVAPTSREEAKAYYDDMKRRARLAGRDPDRLLIIPSMAPYIGSTDAEGQARWVERADLMDLEGALAWVSKFLNQLDLGQFDLDAPFPRDLIERNFEGYQTVLNRMAQMLDDTPNLTLRQLAQRMVTKKSEFVGAPETIADTMQDWFENRLCDGFMVGESHTSPMPLFCHEVVPILQRRGLFRADYEGRTLRENLGLPRPANRFAQSDGPRLEAAPAGRGSA